MIGKLAESDCDMLLDKRLLEDKFYDEGNEEAGFIPLSTILEGVEQIINCDDYISGDIKFKYFVRPETPEESEEAGHSDSVDWFTEDNRVNIEELTLQFEC